MSENSKSGIPMTQENRLMILRRAREIISDVRNWNTGSLRIDVLEPDGTARPTYCVLGAIEQAAYDTQLATEQPDNSFDDSYWNENDPHSAPLGYLLGSDLSLDTFAGETYGYTERTIRGLRSAFGVNDELGYETTLEMLDRYIVEVEQGRAREPVADPSK